MSDEVEVPGINISPPEAAGFPLTREFLELAFDKKVDTFEAKLGTNPGDNYMSVIHAVEVFFHGEKEPNNYLIKCYPTHQGRRDFLDQIDIFSRELFMYEDFLVQLKQLVTDRGAEKVAGLSVAPFHGGNVVGQPCKSDSLKIERENSKKIIFNLFKYFLITSKIQGRALVQ